VRGLTRWPNPVDAGVGGVAFSSAGTEGSALSFEGAGAPLAAATDDDAAGRQTGICSGEERVG
jgi:hypothetical protein